MGYKAVYPEEAINGHRAFIARRRALRPAEEYRNPPSRNGRTSSATSNAASVALGACGRAYAPAASTSTAVCDAHCCGRTHAQRDRIIGIRDNLLARIAEAEREGWHGEVDGLKVSLAGARAKLAQIDQITASSNTSVAPRHPQHRRHRRPHTRAASESPVTDLRFARSDNDWSPMIFRVGNMTHGSTGQVSGEATPTQLPTPSWSTANTGRAMRRDPIQSTTRRRGDVLLVGRHYGVVELLIAVNPDEDSRLPYLLRVPLAGGTWCSAPRGPGRAPRRCTATRSRSTSGPPMR